MRKEIVIGPARRAADIDWGEIWEFRELFYVLTWRDIKSRYKETLLGLFWMLFQPVTTTVIFSIFFGKIAKISSGNLPYPLFVYLGLVIWNFFASAVGNSSNSLFANEGIIKKVYFPRLIIPLSAVLTSVFDFAITVILGILLIFYFHVSPHPLVVLLLPVLLVSLLLFTAGVGLFVAGLKVRFRDVRHIFPFFLQLGLFVTPVIYPFGVLFDYRQWILAVNPLSGVIETVRLLVGGSANVNWTLLFLSLTLSLSMFILGLTYFHRTEATVADII